MGGLHFQAGCMSFPLSGFHFHHRYLGMLSSQRNLSNKLGHHKTETPLERSQMGRPGRHSLAQCKTWTWFGCLCLRRTESTGSTLQSRTSRQERHMTGSVSEEVGHSLPPSTGPMQLRLRLLVPVPPQLTEQAVHSLQSSHEKSWVVGPAMQ